MEQCEEIHKAVAAETALRQSNSPESVVDIRRAKNLKADLKKSTAAVRKAKNISDETLQQLCSDILTVNLARHVQEVGCPRLPPAPPPLFSVFPCRPLSCPTDCCRDASRAWAM